MDAYQEVAEAAAKRKQQIREWAAKQVDPTLAVTEIKEIVPSDPTPEEVQKVNMQGADETLGGPANEEASEGEAPVYEEVADATSEDAEHYGDEANRITLKEVQENDAATAKQEEEDAVQEVEPDSDEEQADPDDDSDEDEAPAKSANKGEWVAYRIKTHGLTEDQANEYTKDDLIAGKF